MFIVISQDIVKEGTILNFIFFGGMLHLYLHLHLLLLQLNGWGSGRNLLLLGHFTESLRLQKISLFLDSIQPHILTDAFNVVWTVMKVS